MQRLSSIFIMPYQIRSICYQISMLISYIINSYVEDYVEKEEGEEAVGEEEEKLEV